jgi:C-terminal processing protease CtpA/Prc
LFTLLFASCFIVNTSTLNAARQQLISIGGTLVVVVEVAPGSIAEKIDIHPNAIIWQIDNHTIFSLEGLTKNLKADLGKTIAIK